MSVSTISPHLTQTECPDQLRKLKGWLIWRYEQRDGEAKPRKVPYYAGGGRRGAHGTPDDRNRLVTFDAAIAAAARKGFTGIGLAMLADWGIVALDFDNAASDGRVREDVENLVNGTYAEFSPSGQGVRAFVQGVCPNKKSFDGPYGFETFHSSGFVTFTGNRLTSVDLLGTANTIAPISDEIRQLISDRLLKGRDPREKPVQSGERLGYTDEQLTEMLKAIDPDEHGYERWLQTGMALHHETDGEGFDLFDEWSSTGAQYPGRDDLQRKWDSFGRNAGPGITIRALMKWAGQAGATVGGPIASADDFDMIEDTPEEVIEKKAKADRFAFIPVGDVVNLPSPGWVIKGIIPKAELGIVYGPSGSGKSFVMLDLCMSIARGIPWRGQKVKQGKVRYIVAEGRGGFRKRIKAYGMHHGVDLDQVPMSVMETAPNFLMNEDVKAVAQAVKASEGADVIVVDTFAKVTPGANENAGEDMGKALDNCRRISEATGALVILVHHTGKDVDRGARGWSGIRAAADFEAEVCKDEASGKRWLQITKQKDGDDDGRWGFKLVDVIVGLDEDDEPITSCVLGDDEAPEKGRARKAEGKEKYGIWEQAVLETFAELQLGGDVLKTELVIQVADKMKDTVTGTVKSLRGRTRRALGNLTSGKKSPLFVEGDLVMEA
jgi:hypothetical protein